jgi:hypothetical protein
MGVCCLLALPPARLLRSGDVLKPNGGGGRDLRALDGGPLKVNRRRRPNSRRPTTAQLQGTVAITSSSAISADDS